MKKIILITFLFTLLITSILPVSPKAASAESSLTATGNTDSEKTVRVGWFLYPGSSEIKDGKYTGYSYDYLMEIAKHTGWNYEFIEKDYITCMEMLKTGELDLLCGLQKTSDREAFYSFPDLPYGETYSVLFTKKDSPLQMYDFENYNGIQVGNLTNTLNAQYFKKYANDNGFTYTTKDFSSADEMEKAVIEGSMDAGVLASYVPTKETRILAKFNPNSTYIITTKGKTDILAGLNRAMNLIQTEHLYFAAELFQKYYITPESIEFTQAELDIINASQASPVLVGILDHCAPISFYNKKEKKYEGLTVELMNLICANTGLNVKYVPVDMPRRAQAQTPNESSPKLILFIPQISGVDDNQDLFFSDSLLDSPLSIAGKAGTVHSWGDENNSFAIVEEFEMVRTYLETKLPNATLIEYATLEDCLTAVSEGKADATLHFQSCISYFLEKPCFSNLKLAPTTTINAELCAAGFTEEAEPYLSIINKSLARISESEFRSLTLNTTMQNTYRMTLSDVFYKYQAPIIVIGFLLTAVIFSLISLYSVKRKNSQSLSVAFHQKEEALLEAQKASAAKGNFMSRMSHEIRTPLNAVIGYNTIARNELTEAKTEEEHKQAEMRVMDCLTKSDIASRHLLTIINDVLDMSAIESGKIKVVNDRFDFKGLISSLTAIFYSQAKSKGVDFQVTFDTQMDEWIVGDQMRVNQILTNLLSNAVKFTPDEGTVTLFIRPHTTEKNIQVYFEVQDTGIGMTEDYLKRIFTPFEQADSSISRRFGGTGLGLSISKTLVDMLGGTISVNSVAGKGTTFQVVLTFERTEQPEEKGVYDFSSINALIVDDDVSTCDYIRLLLTRSGVRSSAVNSGPEAINAVKAACNEKQPYTICLVDWRMPKMDGLETVKQIRSIAGNDIPIIVITAYDFSEVAEKASEVGVSMFISKPLFQSSLFNLLANISGSPAPRDKEKPSSYDFSGARVLLAEDNHLNMEIARKFLTSAKITIDSAWNGQEAVNMFLAAPAGTYSAILMDVQMPVMDGYQATQSIRASSHPEAATIPIIAMTADAFSENIAESHAAGMNAHISKPIDLPLLFQTLKEYIH